MMLLRLFLRHRKKETRLQCKSLKATFTLAFTLVCCTSAPANGTRGRTAPSTSDAIGRDSAGARFYALVGTVYDSLSGRPLEAAQVLLRETAVAQPHFVQTDRAGAFVLSPIKPGIYELVVRRIGYKAYVGQRVARAGRVDTLGIRMAVSPGSHYAFPIQEVPSSSKSTRTIPCRKATITTSGWSEWSLPRSAIALRMPAWFKRDPAEAHVDSVRAAAGDTALTSSLLATKQLGVPRAQLAINVVDAVTLTYGGDKVPEESECREQIGEAQATIFSFNQSVEVGDMAYVGPYIIIAQIRFPGGLSLELFADADKREQQDEMLAAIRTIRRIPRAH